MSIKYLYLYLVKISIINSYLFLSNIKKTKLILDKNFYFSLINDFGLPKYFEKY